MTRFLSCDWGTSFLRVRLIDTDAMHISIIAEAHSPKGISTVYNLWKEIKTDDPRQRILFYTSILLEQIKKIENKTGFSLQGTPLLISGMASSTIGMINLPYQQLPFAIDGSDAVTEYIDANERFTHAVLLISGVRTGNEVMRGEETQLVGAIPDSWNVPGDCLFIFPGTHSKHIVVRGNQLKEIKTYMTGEFFELLSKKSILNSGLEMHQELQPGNYHDSFVQGVTDAINKNLLHTSFRVRTNDLFNALTKKENYTYLSGLLIGTELKELQTKDMSLIYLCCGPRLKAHYETALQVLGVDTKIHVFPVQYAEEAVIRGQFKIFSQFKKQ